MIEFEKVTTRGGDRGESSLYSGERRTKDDIFFQTLGDVDELQSSLGLIRAHLGDQDVEREVYEIQKHLVKIGAEIATNPSSELYEQFVHPTDKDTEALEQRMLALAERASIPDAFVMSGSSRPSAFADMARSIARRAERSLVGLIRSRHLIHLHVCQQYLNRLSDYLFMLARVLDDPEGLR